MSENAEMIDARLVLRLADSTTIRRLTILQAAQGGNPMNRSVIESRFGVSRATAKRDLSVVRRVIREVAP